MPDSIRGALLFLITVLFNLYLFILMIRVILVYVRADYFNPVTQFVTKLTQFIVNPLRKILPTVGQLELSSLVLIFVLEIIKYFLLLMLTFGLPNFLGLILLAFADSLKILFDTFFYAILLQVILSWVQPYSPLNTVLYQFVTPIMRPLQRLIPPVGGFDITPIPALIGLQLLAMLIVNPLMSMGMGIAMS